jgi:hypothetical protein
MVRNTFDRSTDGIKSSWGSLSTEVVAGCRESLEQLLDAPVTEGWLSFHPRSLRAVGTRGNRQFGGHG